ncbi:helix-turn-helix transcriptional regulator [Leekyejoonella antrihumi]|uniref:Helix-turn-helix transcriptional regulator n=1 Tax=Leekyejoonella antrihumi TaxID=1660198 RepID=A0A563DXI9_9MICO|nr:helix-turn-helix transcriptional regulator [Leekyejoonella antrihumi]
MSDPRVLRAIAHPVRNRVLQEVYVAGHSRAADIAEELGIPANQASFHLRQLAKYGLVEPAPEHARDGRDRVWKPVHEHGLNLSLRQLERESGGAAAVSVFRRQSAEDAKAMVDRALRADDSDPNVHVMVNNAALRLTKEEAEQFSKELTDLFGTWRRRTMGFHDGRRTYHLLEILQPMPDLPESETQPR